MSTEQIIRAWKDVSYRQSLSEEEQALLPAHPAGAIELAASAWTRISGEDILEMARSFSPQSGLHSTMFRYQTVAKI